MDHAKHMKGMSAKNMPMKNTKMPAKMPMKKGMK